MKDKVKSFFTYFLIIVFFLCSLFCDFLIIRKMHDNISSVPNVVLNEKKSISADDIDYSLPINSFVIGGFTEVISEPLFDRTNLYLFNFTTNIGFDLVTDEIEGILLNFDLSLSQPMQLINDDSFEPIFSPIAKQSFEEYYETPISIDDFNSLKLEVYISDFTIDEFEITCKLLLNNNFLTEYYLYYDPIISITDITKSFNFNTFFELINSNNLYELSLAYDYGYMDGKLEGYDEGYYDKEEEYENTSGSFDLVWGIISNAFASVYNVFDIELFAGIKLFHILAIPLIISVLYFVIKVLAK